MGHLDPLDISEMEIIEFLRTTFTVVNLCILVYNSCLAYFIIFRSHICRIVRICS